MHTPPAASSGLSRPSGKSRALRHGFTLVELLVATVVLAVGLLALTSAGAATVKLESRGRELSRIATAGETRLELLRGTGCAAAAGQDRSAHLEERWSVTQATPHAVVIVDSIRRITAEVTVPSRVYVFRSAARC